ncbi:MULTISPECIES: DUF5680 domain-containing protein [Kosmotoga]|jgi:hypothetical protein|uniref:DUF5680 domain-containing protein n=1 Tax=Kosmotoga olearia (strain ATCC BAA-1733 / DSM 21960 / TBF 19.5.1) TaxID=521045 RepID=C5CG05_KOSOT|nr:MULTISPECIES: DUF5680 domain-containing protein [Kosmotoga]ACR80499.1 conserved hypothetical protein [Kosmotoga olearia TBF 19.5.1]MDI3524167.1 hypothetical protein [Kosmotoga sp.]MDK2954046.1 hypothetical protein [Kosmotoga sp.]OAA19692.1 XRE family transcriptional regulator [Kosmotoga sp. DU53]
MSEITKEFIQFLIRAKQNTYAGDGEESEPSRPCSKDLHYQEGEFLYIDTYLGSFDFIGEEAVWKNGRPIWGMNYYGRMLVDDIPEGFIKCLKEALKNVPASAPYRGPETFKYGSFEYYCEWKGNVECFEGNEKILFEGKIIYKLSFHGGTLK